MQFPHADNRIPPSSMPNKWQSLNNSKEGLANKFLCRGNLVWGGAAITLFNASPIECPQGPTPCLKCHLGGRMGRLGQRPSLGCSHEKTRGGAKREQHQSAINVYHRSGWNYSPSIITPPTPRLIISIRFPIQVNLKSHGGTGRVEEDANKDEGGGADKAIKLNKMCFQAARPLCFLITAL